MSKPRAHLVIAFEGCSLAGKTNLIETLRTQYAHMIVVDIIAEFTQWVGGVQNLPALEFNSGLYTIPREEFFARVEFERASAVAALRERRERALILVDRTLLACIELRDHLLGAPREGPFDIMVKDGTCIVPDILVLLGVSAGERKDRIRSRIPFGGWEIVFRHIDRDVFARYAAQYFPASEIMLYPEAGLALERTILEFIR